MTSKNEFANLLRRVRVAFGEIREDLEEVENQKKALEEKSKRLALVQRVTEALGHDWRCSVAGHGQDNAWFFVRSFTLAVNCKPISYDPFWARELVDDLAKAEARMHRGPVDANVTLSPPYFPGPNVLGDLSEASRAPCPECGEAGYVVGMRELSHWDGEEDLPWQQSLYIFCIHCPRLGLFAHREDK